MRYDKYKLFAAWDYDKEEAWLNDLSERGLQLVSPGALRYVFEDGTPGEYIYRLELLDRLPGAMESQRYIRFVEETGAEYMGSVVRWVYFRRKAEHGPFELFSDIDSRARHLTRLLVLFGFVGAGLLTAAVTNLIAFFVGENGFNLDVCVLDLALSAFICWGFIKVLRARLRLKKERALHE